MSKNVKAELLAKMQSEMVGFERHIQNTPEVFRNDYADELILGYRSGIFIFIANQTVVRLTKMKLCVWDKIVKFDIIFTKK